MRVLLVEDDLLTVNTVTEILNREKFVVDNVTRGAAVLNEVQSKAFDLIILELMLPDQDGYQVLQNLRAENIHVPVLILSKLSHMENKIQGFNFGADDYVTKPFDQRELVARIYALLRRGQGLMSASIEIGNLRLELGQKQVFVNDKFVNLTAKEYLILEMLMLNQSVAISKEAIMAKLYHSTAQKQLSQSIIAVFICKLRKKLMDLDPQQTNYVHTAWGRGYSLVELPIRLE